MERTIKSLLHRIQVARQQMIGEISSLSKEEGALKPALSGWSIQDVIEHLVLAERAGFDLIYTAAECYREGNPVWTGISENEGLSIEAIIDKTWKPKEKAPPSATPTGELSLGIWLSHFKSCDDLLLNLKPILKGLPLEKVINPHFLCGPLNVIQRLEFIRYHIERHHLQVVHIKKELLF